MNTLGKILVVLNFVFAILVAGFLTYNFALRGKDHSDSNRLAGELDMSRKANAVLTTSNRTLQTEKAQLKGDYEAKVTELAYAQSRSSDEEFKLRTRAEKAEESDKNKGVLLTASLAAQKRIAEENEGLKKVIEDREGRLVEKEDKLKNTTDLYLSRDRDLKFSNERNLILLERVQELERYVAQLVTGKNADVAAALPNDPNKANPPQKFMRGVVENVDATDKSLIRVSLGTDHGLQKNQTLEVFRMSPNAEYLGLVRIEDAHHHTSVGRMIRSPGTTPRLVRVGDTVSSTLNPR